MIESTLNTFLDHHDIRQTRVLIGVSGGADSVALLRALVNVSRSREIDPLVAHFDHALRADSAADAQWVTQLCSDLQIRCLSGRRTEMPLADPSSDDNLDGPQSPSLSEESARKLRYDFFADVMSAEQCRILALAQTADDQVETVLHHVLRGTALKGLSGISAARPMAGCGTLIRPLLRVTRQTLLAYLQSLGQNFRTDETNQSLRYTRNRLRNLLLPELREHVNPQVDEALLRLAEHARDVQASLEFLADELLDRSLLDAQPEIVRLRLVVLQDRPAALLREFFSRLWQRQHWPRQQISFAHLERLVELTRTGVPSRLSLPAHITAIRRDALLELSQKH